MHKSETLAKDIIKTKEIQSLAQTLTHKGIQNICGNGHKVKEHTIL